MRVPASLGDMAGAKSELTPCAIALAHLIDLYATSSLTLPMRQRLAIILTSRVMQQRTATTIVEPGLRQLQEALSSLPVKVLEDFESRLQGTTEPDDLWDLMNSLSELFQPMPSLMEESNGPIQLERSSVSTGSPPARLACACVRARDTRDARGIRRCDGIRACDTGGRCSACLCARCT